MTEKRFEIICEDSSLVDVPVYVISDEKLKFDIYASKKDAERLCTLLNENEQLTKELNEFKQLDIPIDKIEEYNKDNAKELVSILNKQNKEIEDLRCRINSIYTILREERCGDADD